jgi:hypothetical protein
MGNGRSSGRCGKDKCDKDKCDRDDCDDGSFGGGWIIGIIIFIIIIIIIICFCAYSCYGGSNRCDDVGPRNYCTKRVVETRC